MRVPFAATQADSTSHREQNMALGNMSGEAQAHDWKSPKTLSCTAFFSAAISLTLIALLHALEPQYDPSWRFVSEYAAGPYGWLMQIAFLAMAGSFAALAFALRQEVSTRSGRAGLIALCVSAVGCGIAALFSMDPIAPLPVQQTLSGSLHGLGSMIGIPALPVGAMLVTYCVTRGEHWQSSRTRLRLLANLTWMSLVAMFVLLSAWLSANGGQFGPEVPIGWINRIVILAYLGWTIMMAALAAGIAQARANAGSA
jgi:hypothetical protein